MKFGLFYEIKGAVDRLNQVRYNEHLDHCDLVIPADPLRDKIAQQLNAAGILHP